MSNESVLIVEDDEDILQLLQFNFESSGFDVHVTGDGREGLAMARRLCPDIVLLDLMLPGMDGFEICKSLKRDSETAQIPVIMLTARGEEVDRIVGLELGADDYVVKPFSFRELLLRVRAVLRRSVGQPVERTNLERDGLCIDLETYRAFVEGKEVVLTATEFKLLAELVRSSPRVRSRDQLLASVWGYEFEGYARTVDTHIRRLRQKLEGHAALVETVRGVGYRFKE